MRLERPLRGFRPVRCCRVVLDVDPGYPIEHRPPERKRPASTNAGRRVFNDLQRIHRRPASVKNGPVVTVLGTAA